MDKQNAINFHKNTMALKEPRRKRRVRLRPRKPFPINIGPNEEWIIYTGHLSNLGVCVTEPYDIEALHSMGFFGKGSLSRSYPNFEKTRGGVPPIVRRRQWVRRQFWLEQAKNLNTETFIDDSKDEKWENIGKLDYEDNIDKGKQICDEQKSQSELKAEVIKPNENLSDDKEKTEKDVKEQDSGESLSPPQKRFKYASPGTSKSVENNADNLDDEKSEENHENMAVLTSKAEEKIHLNPVKSVKGSSRESHKTNEKSLNTKVDEVVLDSSEEEDEIREISKMETANVSGDKDVVLLNDEAMSVGLEKSNCDDTENRETNTDDDIEMLEREILVLPDSDSDIENYLSQVKPTIEKEGFPVRETMYLTFEEAFFLMFGLGCLQIVDFEGNLLNILDTWNHFCHTQNDFVQRYVVYHYFRSKGWVVKSGLKYGGDFMLYKQGPPFYHASYIVIVEVVDADTLLRIENKTMRKMTWKKLFGLDRLSETAAKELLFAQVLWPSKIPKTEIPSTPELLTEFTVKELLYRRWIPKQNREEIDLEDDND